MLRTAALAVILEVPCSARRQGGPPMITDDPGTPGDGLMAELHADAAARLDRSAPTLNLGARWAATEHGTVLLSLGRNLHNHFGVNEAAIGYLGWQMHY
jgi:hypothetical protein